MSLVISLCAFIPRGFTASQPVSCVCRVGSNPLRIAVTTDAYVAASVSDLNEAPKGHDFSSRVNHHHSNTLTEMDAVAEDTWQFAVFIKVPVVGKLYVGTLGLFQRLSLREHALTSGSYQSDTCSSRRTLLTESKCHDVVL